MFSRWIIAIISSPHYSATLSCARSNSIRKMMNSHWTSHFVNVKINNVSFISFDFSHLSARRLEVWRAMVWVEWRIWMWNVDYTYIWILYLLYLYCSHMCASWLPIHLYTKQWPVYIHSCLSQCSQSFTSNKIWFYITHTFAHVK